MNTRNNDLDSVLDWYGGHVLAAAGHDNLLAPSANNKEVLKKIKIKIKTSSCLTR